MALMLSEFADKINQIMPVVMKEFARRQVNELYKGKITIQQFLILEYLDKEKESKMSELSRFMSVTTADMTGIVARLVKGGYAQRVYDPDDRRIIRVKLTQKSSCLVKKINAQRKEMLVKMFGRLSESDRRDYLRVLVRIKDILINEPG